MNSSSLANFFVRLLSWRLARRALLATAVLATLIGAFYVIENTRGRRAWEKTSALIAANGYTLPRTFGELAPPPASPADNAAETPVLRALYDPDLAVAGAARNRWHDDGETITPDLLEKQASSLAELAAAVRRPRLRSPLPYERGYSMVVPHVSALLDASRLLSTRATLRLQQADSAGAADDVETLFNLAALLSQEEPLLISQLTADVIVGPGQRALATGLESNAWSASQRVRFATALARIDFIAGLRRSWLTEWGGTSIYLVGNPDLREIGMMSEEESSRWRLAGPWIPSGWLDQARALIGHAYMKVLIPSVDPAARRFDLTRLHQATDELIGNNFGNPLAHKLVRTIIPSLHNVAGRLAERQTQIDFARIALALADWRETHGTYPATLAELPPEAGLAHHIHDLLTGQPFTYRPAADRASYRLYAFGPDGKDDGGERPHRDWVWSGGGH